MSNVEEKFYSKENRFNALFLPGFPGSYKECELTNDLKNLGFNIYTISYPGTQNHGDCFDFESSVAGVNKAFFHLNELPLLVISYSYSTLLVTRSIYDNVNNIMGIFFFSPVSDLRHSLKVDFLSDLEMAIKEGKIRSDIESFAPVMLNNSTLSKDLYRKDIDILIDKNIPLIFTLGSDDATVNVDMVGDLLRDIQKEKKKFNQLKIITVENGNHKIDSLYSNIHYKYIIGILAAYELKRHLDTSCSISIRGSLINSILFSDTSDIDFVIITEKELSLHSIVELNKFKHALSDQLKIKLDVSVAAIADFVSDKDSASIRGATFIHEFKFFYLPVITSIDIVIPEIDNQLIMADAKKANHIDINKSQRALLKYRPGTDASNFIIKHFHIGCYYDQFCKNNLIFDHSDLEKYYEKMPAIYGLLQKMKGLKKQKYDTVTLEILREYLEAHILLDKEFSDYSV